MTDERKWCDRCGEYVYLEDEPESECCYLDCPIALVQVRDTGDELGQVLGEALRGTIDLLVNSETCICGVPGCQRYPPSTPPVTNGERT